MTDYFANFVQHGGQIDSFLASAILWVGFFAIGSFFIGTKGEKKVYEAAPFFGWAIINFVLTVLGVFGRFPFPIVAVGLGGIATVALIFAFKREQRLFPAGTVKIILLATPLLLLVSAMVGSQWDEFSDWLISPRLMLETGTFPTAADAHRGGTLAAYPYGWHFVTYLASLIAGRFLENAGALINVFMLLTFSFLSIRFIRTGLGQEDDISTPGWTLCAIGGLSTTLLNTTFVQKVALTSYADVATATVTGLSVVIGWYMLGALAEGKHREALKNALQIGLLMMLLVNLKQSTVVMAVIVVCAIGLAGLRDPKITIRDLFAMLPRMVIPAIFIFIVWRYYIGQELPAREMKMAAFSDWFFEYIPQILSRMLLVLTKKGAYLFLLVVIIGFGIRAMVKYRTPFDRFAIIAGAVFLGHNAFLFVAYLSSFGQYDALRAASYWRYNMQLGMIGVVFTTYGLGILWQKHIEGRAWPKRYSWLPVVLMIIAPFIFANKLRFDRHQPVPYFRVVAAELNDLLVSGNKVNVLDPKGSGESGIIARYELGRIGIYRGFLSIFHHPEKEVLRSDLNTNASHLLVHSLSPVVQEVLALDMDEKHSYLLENDRNGGWRIIKTWEKP
ncbi:MAG: hypothetical protein H8E36_08860 [Rhodospirillaceae bacterium]|nr:hypothetical protein [Rhodospirillaceae bacterium]MBL6940774.1 hypothetical protein [Rhodospirillales bacterium]